MLLLLLLFLYSSSINLYSLNFTMKIIFILFQQYYQVSFLSINEFKPLPFLIIMV